MKIKIIIIVLLFCLQANAQKTNDEPPNQNRSYAEKYLWLALNSYSDRDKMNEKLISKRENAINYAELILFEKYKKEDIEFQKPYQVYLIDDYWIIYGTLPKGYKGGVFSLVFDSWNGKILRITHGK